MIAVRGRSPQAIAIAIVLVLVVHVPVVGQAPGESGTLSRFNVSIGLLNTQPLGELRTGPGIGAALSGTYALDAARIFRLRADFRGSIYDHETREFCAGGAIGCWIRMDLSTSYSWLYGGVGPELVLPLGRFDVALAATAGIGAFSVDSSLKGSDDNREFARTDQFDDTFFSWAAGGEVRVPVSRRVAIALGSHYQRNGRASYVVEGGITQRSDGSLEVSPLTTDANMVAIVLGISIRP